MWEFRVYTYIQVSFIRFCKYLNQRVRRMVEKDGKSFKGVSKTKKKKHKKRLSFITQLKIEFLLPITCYYKSFDNFTSVVFTCYKNLKFSISISIATAKFTFLTR